jgi:hypothetical protein
MQLLTNIHPDLLSILDKFQKWFFEQDISKLRIDRRDDFKKNQSYIECTDRQYLEDALPTPERFGYPRDCYGVDMNTQLRHIPNHFHPVLNKLDDELILFLGARNNALKMYYPPKGFIGWHNNGNAPGYNIIITYSSEGDGAFYTYDAKNDKINEQKDKKGWFVKVGYFGHYKEPEKVLWHSAKTDCDRLTLSYIIYDKNLWENMVDEIGS